MVTYKKAAIYSKIGHPPDVIKIIDVESPSCKKNEVIIDVEIATINPSHLLALSGKYGVHKTLPAVGGGEGVGRITEIGLSVKEFKVGDRVMIPPAPTWSQQVKVRASNILLTLPGDAEPAQLSMLMANPPTAWLLLNKLVRLRKGDWVIQNAANSAVGQYVMQLSRIYGYKTINIVRQKKYQRLVKKCGGDICITEDQAKDKKIIEKFKTKNIRLALDAIAGKNTQVLANVLSDNGVIGNYGLLSGKSCQLSPHDIVFRNISLRGIWLSQWLKGHNSNKRSIMKVYNELIEYILKGEMKAEVEKIYNLTDIKLAIKHAMKSRKGKILLKPN